MCPCSYSLRVTLDLLHRRGFSENTFGLGKQLDGLYDFAVGDILRGPPVPVIVLIASCPSAGFPIASCTGNGRGLLRIDLRIALILRHRDWPAPNRRSSEEANFLFFNQPELHRIFVECFLDREDQESIQRTGEAGWLKKRKFASWSSGKGDRQFRASSGAIWRCIRKSLDHCPFACNRKPGRWALRDENNHWHGRMVGGCLRQRNRRVHPIACRDRRCFHETAGGVTVGVTRKLYEQGRISPDNVTVACITGNGLKTTDALAGSYETPEPIAAKIGEFENICRRRFP